MSTLIFREKKIYTIFILWKTELSEYAELSAYSVWNLCLLFPNLYQSNKSLMQKYWTLNWKKIKQRKNLEKTYTQITGYYQITKNCSEIFLSIHV